MASAEHWADSFIEVSVIIQVCFLSCNFKSHVIIIITLGLHNQSCWGVVATVCEMSWCIKTENMGEQYSFDCLSGLEE